MKRKSWGAHQVKCLKSFPAWRILHRKFVPLLFTLPLISSMRYIKISLNLLGNAIILRNNGFICFQLLTKLNSKNYNCKFCLLRTTIQICINLDFCIFALIFPCVILKFDNLYKFIRKNYKKNNYRNQDF